MFDLSGKIALVTGATGGIGGAVAKTLHSFGAEIIATGRKEDALAKLADELGSRVHVLVGDLGNKDAADKLVADAEAVAGKIDILVNNAGLTRDGLFIRMKDEDWQKVLDVNLTAAFLLSRAAVRGMMKRRMGRIINISSIVGAIGNAGQANYAASKAGLIAMSKCLAQEIAARNVTVNCVAPGFIETPLTDKNQFFMPFLMKPEKAAKIIKKRLQKAPAVIAFPWIMAFGARLGSMLPGWIARPIFASLPKKEK